MPDAIISNRVVLTVDEVRRLLGGKSKSTLSRYVKERGFPEPVQLSTRNLVWYEDEVAEYLAHQPRGGVRNERMLAARMRRHEADRAARAARALLPPGQRWKFKRLAPVKKKESEPAE